ncbi:MAG: ribosome small subunit-dependent GTPase A [Desulfovibrio sp.]|nr:MAG: ribosome small subunit-dependent GTPase A [Desulfovibrio sp.]
MNDTTDLSATPSNHPDLLRQLGWSDFFASGLAAMDQTEASVARVFSVQRNGFIVTNGHKEWLCSPAGRLLKQRDREYPVTGDWVVVDSTVITSIIPRKSFLSRGEAGTRHSRAGSATREQAIAANLDTVFIVCGLDRDFNIRRLERYLALVYNCGLSPVIVLTKADQHDAPESFQQETETIATGVAIVLTSMQDNRGTSELESYLGAGQTVAMIGSSGAGKSTLANMLYGSEIQATGEISASVGKGRHTTTVRELIRMPQGGLLMDNPGIREIAFHEGGDGVEQTFADIQELAEACRFSDCSHQHEPGCAVLNAVESGDIEQDRFDSYNKMKREMEFLESRRNKSADRVEKERWQDVAKMIKHINKKRK